MIGTILVGIGVALAILDLVLWKAVLTYKDRFILQLAVILIGVGVLVGVPGLVTS